MKTKKTINIVAASLLMGLSSANAAIILNFNNDIGPGATVADFAEADSALTGSGAVVTGVNHSVLTLQVLVQ